MKALELLPEGETVDRPLTQLFGGTMVRNTGGRTIFGSDFSIFADRRSNTVIASVSTAKARLYRLPPATQLFIRCRQPAFTDADLFGWSSASPQPPYFMNRTVRNITATIPGVNALQNPTVPAQMPEVTDVLWDLRYPDNRAYGGSSFAYYHLVARNGVTPVSAGTSPLLDAARVSAWTKQYQTSDPAATGFGLSSAAEIAVRSGVSPAASVSVVSRTSATVMCLNRLLLSATEAQLEEYWSPYRIVEVTFQVGSNIITPTNICNGPCSLYIGLGTAPAFSTFAIGSAFNIVTASGFDAKWWSFDISQLTSPVLTNAASLSASQQNQLLQPQAVTARLAIPWSVAQSFYEGVGPFSVTQIMAAYSPAAPVPISSLPAFAVSINTSRGEPYATRVNSFAVG